MEQPKSAGKAPILVDLEEGKTYFWCSCGQSANQPWCNGAHQGSSFAPGAFKAQTTGKAAICTCKLTKNAPYCDGSHAGQ
ncbi:MAG TPA: iron-binding protein [Flavobacteriales bacterium]|nr:iron-binding protein [Flavobacteriales bacterium]